MKLHIFAITLVLILLTPISWAFGHGLSIDTPPTMNFQGRNISITVEMTPASYNDNSTDKLIKVRAFDLKTGVNIKNVNFLIGLNYKNELIFRNFFFAENGDLAIRVYSSNEGEVTISGEKEPLLGGWMATESNPIELHGPVFESGGLYHLEIEIRSIDQPDNLLDNPIKYDAYISIGNTINYHQKTPDGGETNFRVRSYYDNISDFSYEASEKRVTFEMPFDWTEQNISQIPYVHVEFLFPNQFTEFITPSYVAKINNIELFKTAVTIDDYSEENGRIIHFLISKDILQYLASQQKKTDELSDKMVFELVGKDEVKFPVVAPTDNQQFQVDLSWDPPIIQPGQNTRFIFTIRDPVTLETKLHSTYDFVILKDGREIHRASGKAVIGGGFEDYIFRDEQKGPIVVRFEKISGTSASTQFALAVVPEFGPMTIVILILSIAFIISQKQFGKFLSK